jgi:hypothetical protein
MARQRFWSLTNIARLATPEQGMKVMGVSVEECARREVNRIRRGRARQPIPPHLTTLIAVQEAIRELAALGARKAHRQGARGKTTYRIGGERAMAVRRIRRRPSRLVRCSQQWLCPADIRDIRNFEDTMHR